MKIRRRLICVAMLTVGVALLAGCGNAEKEAAERKAAEATAAEKAAQDKQQCIANLKQLDGAKQQWAIELKKNADATPTKADIFGDTLYIKKEPVCPAGGTYTLGSVRDIPTCSHADSHGHSLQ